MNFLQHHIRLVGVLMLLAFAGAAAALNWNVPQRLLRASAGKPTGQKLTCPMHPEVVGDQPGNCPICGMKLVPASAHTGSQVTQTGGGCCAGEPAALNLPPGHPCIRGSSTNPLAPATNLKP